jgi:hypothetical protein
MKNFLLAASLASMLVGIATPHAHAEIIDDNTIVGNRGLVVDTAPGMKDFVMQHGGGKLDKNKVKTWVVISVNACNANPDCKAAPTGRDYYAYNAPMEDGWGSNEQDYYVWLAVKECFLNPVCAADEREAAAKTEAARPELERQQAADMAAAQARDYKNKLAKCNDKPTWVGVLACRWTVD